jgi:hypothetical protein
LLELAQQHGQCGTCSGSMVSERYAVVVRGFRAQVYGTVTNASAVSAAGVLEAPATIHVWNASRSNDATVICGVEQVPPVTPVASPTAGGNMGSAARGRAYWSAMAPWILALGVFLL